MEKILTNEVVKDSAFGKNFALYLGDSAEILKGVPGNSIDYILFSPPFGQLYVYSNSDRDLGNCRTLDEFYTQYTFITKELYRVLKPGRLLSFHCMQLPLSKEKDGVVALRDFRGELIKHHVDNGFLYHSEVCIYKSPVTQMMRTKALGLLHKQLKKDSAMSRQGLADYLVTMRKPGENAEPITHTNESFPVSVWQRYADPVWMDIDQGDTLQYKSVKDEKDEKHLAPLQLGVCQRAIELWTNPHDTVLTPFLGIGSEAYMAVKMGRKAVGIELKDSYYRQAVKNVKSVAEETQSTLFDMEDSE
ncbi:MAG: site-specific DNA-methyltransferase [Acidaminococcaceae bacterium]|nr:site-specific DNA-methyltransferase [Acidaminococcaceae bacterium]